MACLAGGAELTVPANPATIDQLRKFAKEVWTGGVVDEIIIGKNTLYSLNISRTSGEYSSEYYLYKLVEEGKCELILSLPYAVSKTRHITVINNKVLIETCSDWEGKIVESIVGLEVK